MIRLIALNENVNQAEIGDEITLAEEAQERIAEAEYLRAIRLIHQGKDELALSLLNDLLETKVLNEAPTINKNLNLLGIRHNCFKNAAIIYGKKADTKKALKYYVFAIKYDQNDVHAMTRLGQLALRSNFCEMAEFAFYSCLKQNPNHWMAADAILRLLCQNHNILGAYGCALKIHSKDPRCQSAVDIISEINHTFSADIDFCKELWDECCPASVKSKKCLQDNFKSIERVSSSKTFLADLKIDFSNWLSIGNYVILANRYHKRMKKDIFFVFEKNYFQTSSTEDDLKNLIALEEEHVDEDSHFLSGISIDRREFKNKSTQMKVEEQSTKELNNFMIPLMDCENTKNRTQTRQAEPTLEDPELSFKSDSNDSAKSKCKRRCSDLHFLEQWSWHKNRRYSSRKKIQDRSKTDATLKDYLERIFVNYLKPFVDKSWPLSEDSNAEEVENNTYCMCCKGVKSVEEFFHNTQNEFDGFVDNLKKNSFDIISLVFTWLKYLSKFWNVLLPQEVQTTYYRICKFYLSHFDLSTWSNFSREDFMTSYQIFLLFLELDFNLTEHNNSQINTEWKSMYNCLMCHAGSEVVVGDINFKSNMIRLLNVSYRYTKYENNLKKSKSYLDMLEPFFKDSSSASLVVFHLPNLKNSCLDKKTIFLRRSAIKRTLALNEVPRLFKEKKWCQLVAIISENLMHTRFVNDCDYWKRDLKMQFEIIIQALWSLNEFEDCLNWSEKWFDLSVTKYLIEPDNVSQSCWINSINFAISYIECLVTAEGYKILDSLGNYASRLVQNIIKILSFQLDTPYDKTAIKSSFDLDMDIKRIWVVLHQFVLRDEQTNVFKENKPYDSFIDTAEMEDIIPQSFLILFTAHDFLGKQKRCSQDNGALLRYILDTIAPNLRAPSYDSYRDVAYEYLEQVTYCLYGFPTKKTRLRHLEDHETRPIELNLNTAIQLFDIYRPESLPEFNSYKLESVSSDMEQLLLKIATLVLNEIDTIPATTKIMHYINGDSDELLQESDCIKLPYKISSIFYLLADYYFKNRDFSKTIKYYTIDLACNPCHLDSWAGMALSKASKIESQLNEFVPIEIATFLSESENIIRCFEQCRLLNPTHTLLWIEYGSFAYTIYSFCSRHLKQLSPKMSISEFSHIEKQKEKMLNIAFNCFSSANNLQNNWIDNDKNGEETHDEKWLCRYMLGKITEKQKEEPKVYLNHYLRAAHYLYESNATYPIKINHSNPTPLSVEALEVYYRTNSAILKFLESETEIDRETGDYFRNVLKNLSSSPFAFNKAKIDGNSLNILKRSLKSQSDEKKCPKMLKLHDLNYSADTAEAKNWAENSKDNIQKEKAVAAESSSSTVETVKHGSSLTSSSVSSSSDSLSDSDMEINNDTKSKAIPYSKEELVFIYNALVNNLEECITRFPEHFKSIYRLVFHYMNAPENLQDLDRCEDLLLGQYTTGLGNQINGIFCDRKSNNIFNGIWRLPSSEIDRPGSFSTHMVKCVSILIQMLVKRNNHKLLIEVGLQLYKTPDNDKRYIKDTERLELYHQSMYFCVQIVRDILKKNTIIRDNSDIMSILIDMYKAYKKCLKYMNEKEPLLTQLLIDIYKLYIHNKVSNIPENCNYLDIVIKFCAQEINLRKNQGRQNNDVGGTKPKNLQNIVFGINKLSIIFEKDLQPKEQFAELSPKNAQIMAEQQFSTEQESNTFSSDKPTTMVHPRNNYNASKFSSLVYAFGSAGQMSDDNRISNLVAEYYKMLEISKEDREKCLSLQRNFPDSNSYQGFQKSIPEHLSITEPELKLDHYSAVNSYDDENQRTLIKPSEFSTTPVYLDREVSDNESPKSRQNSKEVVSKPFLISEKLNSSFKSSSHNYATHLDSSEKKSNQNFQQTNLIASCLPQSSKHNYTNEAVSVANTMFCNILNSPEYNESVEKELKSRINIASTKVKKSTKPYNREVNNPSIFSNTCSIKNSKSLSSHGVTDPHSLKEYPLELKLNPEDVYKAFSNDKLTMSSLLTMQSELIPSKQSSSDVTNQFNSDALKLSPTDTLQQLLISHQNYSEPMIDTGFCEAPSNNPTSANDVIILD